MVRVCAEERVQCRQQTCWDTLGFLYSVEEFMYFPLASPMTSTVVTFSSNYKYEIKWGSFKCQMLMYMLYVHATPMLFLEPSFLLLLTGV